MRFSTLINQTIKSAAKGKDTRKGVNSILTTVLGAVKAYSGKGIKVLKANKKLTVDTGVRGCQSLSILDEESLLYIVKSRHTQAVLGTCDNADDDNYNLNAELCRALATDNILLGACYWLSNPDTASTKLL